MNKKVMDVLSIDLCKKMILFYYDMVVGKGSYYTMDEAKMIIQSNTNKQKNIALCNIIDLIDRCGSIWAAKAMFIESRSIRNNVRLLISQKKVEKRTPIR